LPNPASDKVFIAPGNRAFREIKVVDMNGRLLHVWRITPGKGMMTKDISHLANGIYLLLFQGASEQYTLRLIKQ
jgi:hypothetical protein